MAVAAMIPMIAMATIISIRVKPLLLPMIFDSIDEL
jgi:hypothetical protein